MCCVPPGKKPLCLPFLLIASRAFCLSWPFSSCSTQDTVTALSGAAAVLGHNFPVYLRFKGGKGVATGYGVILAVAPWTGLLCLIVWLLAALIWRYSSLVRAHILCRLSAPDHSFREATSKPLRVLSLFLFGLIYYRHRENIKRLIAGTEPKIGKK